MLTLKLITEEKERVIAGLKKKCFTCACQAIDEVIAVDKARRTAQKELDQSLNDAKKLAAEIGMLMKQGKREEAEAIKAKVAALKETSKELESKKEAAEQELNRLLCQIPNIPYDEVPEGTCAEDNWVVKSNLKKCIVGEIPLATGMQILLSRQPNSRIGNWQRSTISSTSTLA